MKTYLGPLVLCALLQGAASHYVFSKLLVNNTETDNWKYVRDVGKAVGYTGSYSGIGGDQFGKTPPYKPVWNGQDYAMRCGREAEKAANKTETATIIAGTEVGFRIHPNITGAYNSIGHPGPAQVYLHRTDDLQNDIGDGDWFKIGYEGPINDTYWAVWGTTDVNFTVPATTPPGTYLLRIEHMMPFNSNCSNEIDHNSQWYVNCAHVNIVGSGGGTPGPVVKIPDVYHGDEPGICLRDPMDQTVGLSKYVPPGPPVWRG